LLLNELKFIAEFYFYTMKKSLSVFVEAAIKDSFFIESFEGLNFPGEYPLRLSYHRMILVNQGAGHLKIDENVFPVRDKQLFLMAKGQICDFSLSSSITGYMLHFGDCFWEKAPTSASNCKAVLFNNAAANQYFPLSEQMLTEIELHFQKLENEFNASHYINQPDVLAAYLKIIMIKTANLQVGAEERFNSQDYILYRKFLDLLSANFAAQREVSGYAKLLGLTGRRLSDLCNRCSGKNAKEIINGQLIAEAKRSLQFSSNSIKEIAYQLNFITPEQFSHFFKKNTDFSPLDYRSYFVSIGA
jgi:AraC family transcriptional activator of pobA